jgi:hypothetical protein
MSYVENAIGSFGAVIKHLFFTIFMDFDKVIFNEVRNPFVVQGQ